ncbi:ABC transporter ATP-binding protein [Elizabethkingia anophelis]|uniref:AAA family ATPase n=1 Tax=Elizabethkingia anophelis TaxID=1117645 RepID=UPI000998F024|nr:AAA family ATPase [Elizabethkingia anophelis]ELB0066895.1 AAA family ATPase [Elizabethkingia anophelis]ELB1891589.1 AAA family ATPase [Elizabethkingia anophelis]MDV2442318.1 ABC transporter ATP-binding protein [Elizabethkingia anophelis]MDV3893438.1 ABC transporter ATP-binding protein [Elizabethkingia anophelis]MDV3915771.1 ABC transporter ATP-binding protein [Elizabethkingia anophelis]
MSTELDNFITFIKEAKKELEINRQAAFELRCSNSTLEIFDKVLSLLPRLEEKTAQGEIKVNYINQFQSNLNNIFSMIPFRGRLDTSFLNNQDEHWKVQTKRNYELNSLEILKQYEQVEFNIDFFNKIGYFDNNVVAIGANGSGKTTLSNKFKTYLQNNGVVISAQRILLVPNFDSIANPTKTAIDLKEYQIRDKSNKSDGEFNYLQKEFGIVLKNLLADNISVGNLYRKKAIESKKSGEDIEDPQYTNLDITFEIWNSLIEHRTISCDDGINIKAKAANGDPYPAIQMSDGEKVMLYLIAQVLQAPKDGFIVVDEPEMYLHKTILKKLWDLLEAKRTDCIFIYLTHDLDFATSRTTAKKIWIKSFTHPNKWDIEDIPTDEIPETLMFELLGSRKNILFCEGVKGSIDERIYSILFPELTIMPVGSCFDVMNHTKAFNKLLNVNTNAFGLIDSDHHDTARLEKLKENNVFSFNVAEVENLFLDEEFLKILAKQILADEANIELIKSDVIKELDKLKELQASNYVSTKINYYFTDSDVSKGNDLAKLSSNYQDFIDKIKISDWHAERISELEKIVSDSDYNKALISFNNKGIISKAEKHLNISDFTDRSIKLLQSSDDAKVALENYFPEEIKTAGKKVLL